MQHPYFSELKKQNIMLTRVKNKQNTFIFTKGGLKILVMVLHKQYGSDLNVSQPAGAFGNMCVNVCIAVCWFGLPLISIVI